MWLGAWINHRDAVQSESSVAMQLELDDIKAKVLRLTEQGTEHDGRLSFLAQMSTQVDLLQDQIIKWRLRLPDLTDDNSSVLCLL